MTDLKPTHGARYLLSRQAVDEDEQTATYGATILADQEETPYVVKLELGGTATLERSPDGDAKMEDTLVAIARQIARSAVKNRAQGLPAWPRRILRWKGPGRGG